jgi:transposase InsO family protein
MTSEDVINRLAELFVIYGVPEAIRSDNGPEFVAKAIQDWLAALEITTLYIEPGRPWQNGYAESFHSRLRDELLNMEEFDSMVALPRFLYRSNSESVKSLASPSTKISASAFTSSTSSGGGISPALTRS